MTDKAIFVVGNQIEYVGTVPAPCHLCGAKRYTAPENLAAAKAKNAEPICMDCFELLQSAREGNTVFGGMVKDGEVRQASREEVMAKIIEHLMKEGIG